MKKLCTLFLVLVMMVAAAAAEETTGRTVPRLEGEGFDTPEEAVMAYLEALNRGDVGGMLSTFAMESFVGHMNPELYLERNRVFTFNMVYTVPTTDEYAQSLILYNRYGRIAQSLLTAYAVNTVGGYENIRFNNLEEIRGFAQEFEESPMNGLIGNVEFVQWINPFALMTGSATVARMGSGVVGDIAYYGADDYTELVTLIRAGGSDAVQVMSCVKYGDRWYNADFTAQTALATDQFKYPVQQVLRFLTEEESRTLATKLLMAIPQEAVRWDAVRESGLGGSRWPLVSLNVQGVTVYSDPSTALNDEGAGVWAELHFFSVGGAVITVKGSPALRQTLGMADDTARISLPWLPDEFPLAYPAKTGKMMSLVRFIDLEDLQLDFEGLEAIMAGDTVTFTFSDGTEAVFKRP